MFCKHCGTKNEAGSRFCDSCGTKMVMSRQDRTEKSYDDTEFVSQDPVAGHSKGMPYDREGFVSEPSPETQDNGHSESVPKKRKKLLLMGFGALLLAVLLLAGWLFMGFQNTRAFNDAMEEGNRYLLEENLEQAEAHFLRAIEINPREVEPYLQLANIYREWGEPERAIDILEQGREAVSEEDRSALEEVLDEIRGNGGVHLPADEEVERDGEDELSEPRFRWVLEPSIEADDINYLKDKWHQAANMNRRQFLSSRAVIRRGNAYGLIDQDGNIEGEVDFEHIEIRHRTYILRRESASYQWTNERIESFTLQGGGVVEMLRFYYHSGLEFIITFGGAPPERESVEVPDFPFPVMNTAECFHDGNPDTSRDLQYGIQWYDSQGGLYGIFYQGQMITDFVFTSTGSWLDGAIAVEQDGRWGYVNERGEVIIPIEFDASWNWSYWRTDGPVESAFAASEGFIPLVRDGVWEMRDIHGEVVIPPGIFEAIRPVYQGRSWVKKDGLWGIIEIISNEEMEVEEVAPVALFREEMTESERDELDSFFTNFAVVWLFEFDRNSYHASEPIYFAIHNSRWMDRGRFSTAGMISFEVTQQVATRFLGVGPICLVEFEGTEWVSYSDGYFHFMEGTGAPPPFAKVLSFVENEDGTFTVEYNVYFDLSERGVPENESFSHSVRAIVQVYEGDESVFPGLLNYQLVFLEIIPDLPSP